MTAPVVVIGSGPSGAMAAFALHSRGIPTVVLESGSEVPSGQLVRAFGRTIWRRPARMGPPMPFAVSGDPATLWFSDYAVGGLSNFWTGAVPRFAPGDFSDGAELGPEYVWQWRTKSSGVITLGPNSSCRSPGRPVTIR